MTYSDHLVIPDTHVQPGVDLDHLFALGELIVNRKPDVIVHLGDFADMKSLCSHNNNLQFEGQRYTEDIRSAQEGMSTLLFPLRLHNEVRSSRKKRTYNPRMILTLGNHEDRIRQVIDKNPQLEGVISVNDLGYHEYGWEVVPFKEIITVDGVNYVHYAQQERSSNPIPRPHLIAQRKHASFTVGHTQGLEYYLSHGLDPNGNRIQCIVAGSFYMHDEDYLGPQGNQHWRGVIYKHRVSEGNYDPEFISLDRILRGDY